MVGMRERGEVYDFMVNLVSKVTKKFDASLGPFLSVMMPIGIINTEKLHLTLKKVAFRLEKWWPPSCLAETYRKIPLIPSIHHKSGVVKSRQSIASSQQKLSNDTFLT